MATATIRLDDVAEGRSILPLGTTLTAVLPAPHEESSLGAELAQGKISVITVSAQGVTYILEDGTLVPAHMVCGFSLSDEEPPYIPDLFDPEQQYQLEIAWATPIPDAMDDYDPADLPAGSALRRQ